MRKSIIGVVISFFVFCLGVSRSNADFVRLGIIGDFAGNSRVAIGDFNTDGLKDVVITGLGEHAVYIFLQKPNHTFNSRIEKADFKLIASKDEEKNAKFHPRDVCVGDFNGDGKDDIAVVEKKHLHLFYQPFVDLNLPGFSGDTGNGAATCTVGDIGDNGILDILSGNWAKNVGIWWKQGRSVNHGVHFEWPGRPRIYGRAAIGSLNQRVDNKNDIAFCGSDLIGLYYAPIKSHKEGPNALLESEEAYDVVIKDVNNDGLNDLIIPSHHTSNVAIFYQKDTSTPPFFSSNPDEVITDVTGTISLGVGDLNGDGLNDIAVNRFSQQRGETWIFYQRKGDDKFASSSKEADLTLRTSPYGMGIAISDLNGDGLNDIVISSHQNPTCIFLQKSKREVAHDE